MSIDFLIKSYKFPNSIEEIDKFSGKEFEKFLFEYFKLEGIKTILTDDTGDRGIDLTIIIDEMGKPKKIGIQAKRWKQSVGQSEIAAMVNGKDYYTCDELWIITTSSLTAQAQNTALNNDIKILTRNDVIDILNEIKKNDNARFTEQKPTNDFPKSNDDFYIDKKPNNNYEKLYRALSDLRKEIALENNIKKLFWIFTNATIESIIEVMPKTLNDLEKVKGLGDKKIDLYGKQILETINNFRQTNIEIVDIVPFDKNWKIEN